LDWLGKDDPRQFSDSDLENKYHTWLSQEKAQWEAIRAREKAEEVDG